VRRIRDSDTNADTDLSTTDMAKRRDIAQFIQILREVEPRWMRERFTNGACYELHRMLVTAWPEGEPWIARFVRGGRIGCHVFTRYGDEYFDIAGPHRLATILKYARKQAGTFDLMNGSDHANAREMNPRRLATEAQGAVEVVMR